MTMLWGQTLLAAVATLWIVAVTVGMFALYGKVHAPKDRYRPISTEGQCDCVEWGSMVANLKVIPLLPKIIPFRFCPWCGMYVREWKLL